MPSSYDLQRFLNAHHRDFPTALSEITAGRKRSHWMWYIFPQLRGLGRTDTAQHYGIVNLGEAEAFLNHPVLGPNLTRISEAALAAPGSDATAIFGTPDDLKLRSSMTLFAAVPGAPEVFRNVLKKFYNGLPDEKTLHLLKQL